MTHVASPSNNADEGRGLSEGVGPAPKRDLLERMREHGNALRCHPVANGTIAHTEEAGELLAEGAEELARLRAHCREVEQGTRHACSIEVWMTLQEATQPDADDKGLDGWMREAERRVKLGPKVRGNREPTR